MSSRYVLRPTFAEITNLLENRRNLSCALIVGGPKLDYRMSISGMGLFVHIYQYNYVVCLLLLGSYDRESNMSAFPFCICIVYPKWFFF